MMVNLQQKKNMKDRFRYVSRRDKQTRFGRNNKAGPAEMRARFCHNLVPLVLLVGAVLVPCAITTLRMLGEASVPLLGSSAELLEDKPFGEGSLGLLPRFPRASRTKNSRIQDFKNSRFSRIQDFETSII